MDICLQFMHMSKVSQNIEAAERKRKALNMETSSSKMHRVRDEVEWYVVYGIRN